VAIFATDHSMLFSCNCLQDFVYWADAARPLGSLFRMRKFRNASADNNAVTRVDGQLALLTDVCIRHELRQPTGELHTTVLTASLCGCKFK